MRAPLLFLGLAAAAPWSPSCDATARPPPAARPVAAPVRGPPGAPPSAAAADPRAIAPGPVLSRSRRVEGWSAVNFSRPERALDGDRNTSWTAGRPTKDRPAWLSIELGPGPTRVLFTWSAGGSFDYNETDYGSPGAYRVDTSADSTNGENGSWKTAVDVPEVGTHGASHAIDFAGQRWVRMVVTGVPAKSPNGVQIDEIRVHDATAGAQDSWFFMGDSITAFAFGRSVPRGQGFADRVRERHPGHEPAVINGGIGGDKSDEGLGHLEAWLVNNREARFWGIGYGSNDAAGEGAEPSRFGANLRSLVGRLKAAGKVPIVATIPYASDGNHPKIPRFNEVIEAVRREGELPAGPDLYAWFAAHPEELRDGLHPDEKGIASINRLWAAAVDGLYGR